jgi:hypothetical protein
MVITNQIMFWRNYEQIKFRQCLLPFSWELHFFYLHQKLPSVVLPLTCWMCSLLYCVHRESMFSCANTEGLMLVGGLPLYLLYWIIERPVKIHRNCGRPIPLLSFILFILWHLSCFGTVSGRFNSHLTFKSLANHMMVFEVNFQSVWQILHWSSHYSRFTGMGKWWSYIQ